MEQSTSQLPPVFLDKEELPEAFRTIFPTEAITEGRTFRIHLYPSKVASESQKIEAIERLREVAKVAFNGSSLDPNKCEISVADGVTTLSRFISETGSNTVFDMFFQAHPGDSCNAECFLSEKTAPCKMSVHFDFVPGETISQLTNEPVSSTFTLPKETRTVSKGRWPKALPEETCATGTVIQDSDTHNPGRRSFMSVDLSKVLPLGKITFDACGGPPEIGNVDIVMSAIPRATFDITRYLE